MDKKDEKEILDEFRKQLEEEQMKLHPEIYDKRKPNDENNE